MMTENFGTLSIDTEDSIRECIKQEEWLTNGESIYGVAPHHHNIQQAPLQAIQNHPPMNAPIFKQNGIPANDYYQYPPYIDQLDYRSYSLIGQEQNVDTGEIWDKGNQSTSFEHEQPLSNSILNR